MASTLIAAGSVTYSNPEPEKSESDLTDAIVALECSDLFPPLDGSTLKIPRRSQMMIGKGGQISGMSFAGKHLPPLYSLIAR